MTIPTVILNLTGDDAERLFRIMAFQGSETPETVVGEALAALEEQSDTDLDTWLREVVAARIDAFHTDPSRAMSLEEARRRLLSGR